MEEVFRVSGDMFRRSENLWKYGEFLVFVMNLVFYVMEDDLEKDKFRNIRDNISFSE